MKKIEKHHCNGCNKILLMDKESAEQHRKVCEPNPMNTQKAYLKVSYQNNS